MENIASWTLAGAWQGAAKMLHHSAAISDLSVARLNFLETVIGFPFVIIPPGITVTGPLYSDSHFQAGAARNYFHP